MKSKRVIHLTVLMCVAVTVGCLLAYRHSSSSRHQRINSVSNLKQVGLSFRMGRNDFNGPFTLTGSVVMPKTPSDEQ
jgi:hypothetical protein